LELAVWEMIFAPIANFLTITFLLFVQKLPDINTIRITTTTTAYL
jgi:hypothetical protein